MGQKNYWGGWALKATDSEIKRQVEYYDKLKPWQSFRGISSLLIAFSIILTFILASFHVLALNEVFLDLILMAIIGIFVYRGSKIAIVIAGIYWTINKALVFMSGSSNLLVQLIWWWLFIFYFYKAWQVEKARKTRMESGVAQETQNQDGEQKPLP